MTKEEFADHIANDPVLYDSILGAGGYEGGFGRGVSPEALMITIYFMYPLVRFVIREIGLPWLHEASRYSDLWRLRFDKWIDEEYHKQDIDVEKARKAGVALREELRKITDKNDRKAWEQLAALINKK